MSLLGILISGAKILAGIATGVAVFLGLSGKWGNPFKTGINPQQAQQAATPPDQQQMMAGGVASVQPQTPGLVQIPTRSDSVIAGLRKINYICGGVGEVVQSLVTVVSSIGKVSTGFANLQGNGGMAMGMMMPQTNCIGGPREYDPFANGMINYPGYGMPGYRHNPNWGPDPDRPYRITSDGTQILQRRNDFIVDMYPNPAHPSNRQEFANAGYGFNGGFEYTGGINNFNGDPI